VWLLQSRPITTPTGRPGGPVLGAGPLAETFPEPLGRLEADLWLAPLGEGLEQALLLTGTVSSRALRRSPVVRSLDGWAVADLAHLGVAPVRHKLLRRLDPRPPSRRLRAAWRTGRLSRALPALARDVVEQVDADLAAVPRIDELSNPALLAVLDNGRTALRALHGYEALAGMLVPETGESVTAASLALSVLAEARAEGVDIDDLVESNPVVLALSPPRIGGEPSFGPAPVATIDLRAGAPALAPVAEPAADDAVVREALRLRARWVQELTARVAWELGHRLVCVGLLPDQEAVRLLRLDELQAAARTRTVPADLPERIDSAASSPRPLPAQFRLTADGTAVALTPPSAGPGGVGAGGGAGSGPVHVGDDPPAGAVLVVTHLDPRLATVVPRLAGLVAETGSPLSHLAILAREHGVPTVVGHAGATERYHDGEMVEVDGTVGSVRSLGADRPAEAPATGGPTTESPAGDDPATGGHAARHDAHHGADDEVTGDEVTGEETTVVTLPSRPVLDLSDEPAPAAHPAARTGADIIPIGARR
jgi:pyruvate,water dikinase